MDVCSIYWPLEGRVRILVCIRAVPQPCAPYYTSEGGRDQSTLSFRVNEYDLYAMEEAVRVKEREGAEITAVTVGRPWAEEPLRKAMSVGADQGLVIDDSGAPAEDALSTAGLIAGWARDKGFSLVLCGVMSEDKERCQTGPMLAELLGMRCATTVIEMELDPDKAKIKCKRELEGGVRERVELGLPALLTVQSGINTPRYASLTNVLRVKGLDIPQLPAESLHRPGPCERLVKTCPPEHRGSCRFLEGGTEDKAGRLVREIREKVKAR